MALQHTYTAAEVLEIVNTMASKEKEVLKKLILKEEADFGNLVEEDLLNIKLHLKHLFN